MYWLIDLAKGLGSSVPNAEVEGVRDAAAGCAAVAGLAAW